MSLRNIISRVRLLHDVDRIRRMILLTNKKAYMVARIVSKYR